MPIFVIAVAIIVVILLLGMLIAFGASRLEQAVQENEFAISNVDRAYNPMVSLGHRITLEADYQTQLMEARELAAMKAASRPRGANMGIGRYGVENLKTASQGLENDPVTAVRIAAYHGWDGAKTGVVTAAQVAPAPAAATAKSGPIELVPGKDYPVVEVTDDMSPDEKRKARIANAKAKSAAMKAAKEAQEAAPAVAQPAVRAAQAPAAAVTEAANVPEPPEMIEITDEMSPDEVRKARIANAKAKSAYNKALKAAGVDPQAAAEAAAPASAGESAPATTAESDSAAPADATSADLSSIPAPDYVEITDDMSPEEIRNARINNAKARSAYIKALKAAGIDPKTVDV